MHYEISNGVTIKSENAAKSYTQPSKYVLNILEKLENVNFALDYGCGKARYTLSLCNISNHVDAIDSLAQVTREQVIWGTKTKLTKWCEGITKLSIYAIEEFHWEANKYDFILNTNVLSSIPYERDRITVLHNIKKGLNDYGKALITSQYRNSYFSSYRDKTNTYKFNDGWIIQSRGNYSFYGLIDKNKLLQYANLVGLSVEKLLLHDGSVYLFVNK